MLPAAPPAGAVLRRVDVLRPRTIRTAVRRSQPAQRRARLSVTLAFWPSSSQNAPQPRPTEKIRRSRRAACRQRYAARALPTTRVGPDHKALAIGGAWNKYTLPMGGELLEKAREAALQGCSAKLKRALQPSMQAAADVVWPEQADAIAGYNATSALKSLGDTPWRFNANHPLPS